MIKLNILSTRTQTKAKSFILFLLCLSFAFLVPNISFAQKVKASIDTTDIRYGEEIKYTISVRLDSIQEVIFPEGQTFSPFETIAFYPIDTLIKQQLFELKRSYGITNFDSGSYTLPQQFILINDKPIATESFNVRVHSVAVDTLAQPMYSIKPFVPVKKLPFPWITVLIWVLGITLISFIIWYAWTRKKKDSQAEKPLLPPLEEAIQAFKELDSSDYLVQNNSKEYYSALTNILKRYLDREVTEDALESTTEELIMRLHALRNSQKILFKQDLLRDLEIALKRADLIKFANMHHEVEQVEKDRILMETMVVETNKIIPIKEEEESEEDLENRILQEKILQKKKQKTWNISIASLLLLLGLGYAIYFYYGKEDPLNLDDSQWITSAYGYPPLVIKTPEVLVRTDEYVLKESGTKDISTFTSGKLESALYVMVESLTKNPENPPAPASILELSLKQLERKGAENLLVKLDEFNIEDQAEGMKAHGIFTIENQSDQGRAYELYLIDQPSALYQVLLVYPDGDIEMEKVKERILESIKFQISN